MVALLLTDAKVRIRHGMCKCLYKKIVWPQENKTAHTSWSFIAIVLFRGVILEATAPRKGKIRAQLFPHGRRSATKNHKIDRCSTYSVIENRTILQGYELNVEQQDRSYELNVEQQDRCYELNVEPQDRCRYRNHRSQPPSPPFGRLGCAIRSAGNLAVDRLAVGLPRLPLVGSGVPFGVWASTRKTGTNTTTGTNKYKEWDVEFVDRYRLTEDSLASLWSARVCHSECGQPRGGQARGTPSPPVGRLGCGCRLACLSLKRAMSATKLLMMPPFFIPISREAGLLA